MDAFDYHLPPERIAHHPAEPRDNARLLVYMSERDEIHLDHFYNIAQYIQPKSLMVLNETVVAPARVTLHKQTGGKVICLFMLHVPHTSPGHIDIMVDRKLQVGDMLYMGEDKRHIVTCIAHKYESIFTCRLAIEMSALVQLLHDQGVMPIPPYINAGAISQNMLREQYQTIYAQPTQSRETYSIAAPTAGLHFTHHTLSSIAKHRIEIANVMLEVGLGTFAPLTQRALDENKLHVEWYRVPQDTQYAIKNAKRHHRPIIAVGTTTVRTLESFSRLSRASESMDIDYVPTDIFIRHPFTFQVVSGLVTNFHLPKSSLMMLVDAFLQHKGAQRSVQALYNVALSHQFMFYSFGDAMLIL